MASAKCISAAIQETVMNNLFNLQGKRILITGSGQGIGLVMAQGLAQYGAEIIINDISPEAGGNDIT
jgi:2-polyprenyl-3-methyl-5-hydroxy-6-metoxy-1,4-benzoquinol methylase